MVSSDLTQKAEFLRAQEFMNGHGLLSQSVPSQPACKVPALSAILEGDTQAQSGRGTQSKSHSTRRSRAKARTQISQINDCGELLEGMWCGGSQCYEAW